MTRRYRASKAHRRRRPPPPKAPGVADGASRKRRPARNDGVDERDQDAVEDDLRERKPSSMNKVQLRRLREDQCAKQVNEDEAEALRKQFQKMLVVIDEKTGAEREIDVSKPADLEYMAREQNVDVLARQDGVHGMPKDMRTGMISMAKNELPGDLNSTGVLPLSGFQVKLFMRDAANSIADILMWMPIIPIPVFTPKLLNLIMLGTPSYPTQDSFQLLKTYIAVLQLFNAGETVHKRGRAAFEWLCQRIEDNSVTRDDVTRIADNVTFKHETEDTVRADVLRLSLLQKFDADELTVESAAEFIPFVATVARYDGAEWAPSDRVFADDIMEEHSSSGSELCAEVGVVVDRALEAFDATIILGIVQHYTLMFLRLYEASIMRMLQEASKLGDTIPLKYFGDLASPADRIPDASEVHLSVRESVRKAREFLADVRNETMDLGVTVAHNAPAESNKTDTDELADAAHNDCVPTVEELYAYLAFVNYHASDENALVNAVARIQTAVHVVEPKEIVEGISVADVQEEAVAESAVGTTDAVEVLVVDP